MNRQFRGRRWTAAAAAIGAGLAGAGAAHAQTTPGQAAGTPQQLNPAGQTEQAVRARARDVFSGAPPAECARGVRESAVPFVLRSVQIEGSKALSQETARKAYAGFIGQSIRVGQICEIADRVSAMLFRRGVLARVYVPEQRFSSAAGQVRIGVVEARIVAVRFHIDGDVGPVEGRVEAYLDKLRGLAPFDLDTAQHYLLLANDLPGVRVMAALRHSSVETGDAEADAGAVDLDVTVSRRAVDEIVAVQNTSSKALGPWSGIARVDLNSFTSLGERTSLVAYSTLGNSEQQVFQVLEQAQVGHSGLFLAGSFAYGLSRPGDVLAPLHLRGDSIVGTVEADYPALLLRRQKLTLAAGLDVINQKTDFPGGGVLTDDALRVIWARAEDVAQHESSIRAGQITASSDVTLQLRKGLDILGSSQLGEPFLSRIQGRPDAWVLRGEGRGVLRFDPTGWGVPVSLSLDVQGQYTDTPLLAYEELPIGNLTIGRGYDPDALSGDRVIGGEIRGQLGPIPILRKLRISPYGFYDRAYVANLDTGSVNRTVRSVGGGVEFRLPFGLRGDVAYAEPLDKTFATATKKPPSRVLVQIVFAH